MKTVSIRFLSSLITVLGLASMASQVSAQIPDKFGPLMLSATVLEEPLRTNRIQLAWNEPVNFQNSSNLRVVLIQSNIVVGISNLQYNPGTYPDPRIPPTVTLTMSTTNWFYRSNYFILANNIRDGRNNVIAPNSIIGVTWPGIPAGPLPPSATPKLDITRVGANGVRISWPTNAYNYALDWTTNITLVGTNAVAGPWCEEQPLMANPFIANPASGIHRIYRLRKTQ